MGAICVVGVLTASICGYQNVSATQDRRQVTIDEVLKSALSEALTQDFYFKPPFYIVTDTGEPIKGKHIGMCFDMKNCFSTLIAEDLSSAETCLVVSKGQGALRRLEGCFVDLRNLNRRYTERVDMGKYEASSFIGGWLAIHKYDPWWWHKFTLFIVFLLSTFFSWSLSDTFKAALPGCGCITAGAAVYIGLFASVYYYKQLTYLYPAFIAYALLRLAFARSTTINPLVHSESHRIGTTNTYIVEETRTRRQMTGSEAGCWWFQIIVTLAIAYAYLSWAFPVPLDWICM